MEIRIWAPSRGRHLAIDTILDSMVAAETADMVWRAQREFFAAHGFDRLIYADFTGPAPILHDTYPDAFGAYYSDICNPDDDPFLRYCCASIAPVGTGIDYLDEHTYLTAAERKVILAAREAGMRAGFSCTFHPADHRGVGGWNIGSTLARAEVENILAEQGATLRLVALYAHECMARLRAAAPERPQLALSSRERDCLGYLAAGLRTKQIADRLGIKAVTVELHLRRARDRLGAATREQALAKAISLGLLRL
jgi:DNA-binding CsgD family transcriptional regulator